MSEVWITETFLPAEYPSGNESAHQRRKSGQRACVQKSSGDDVVDVSQGIGRVEVDDEVGGFGEIQASAAARTHRGYINTARSLARQKVPEDQSAVL